MGFFFKVQTGSAEDIGPTFFFPNLLIEIQNASDIFKNCNEIESEWARGSRIHSCILKNEIRFEISKSKIHI